MVIKLHLFRLPSNKRVYGHLVSDSCDKAELCVAAESVGVEKGWIQEKPGKLAHFDLWGLPLRKAKRLFPIVDNTGIRDILREERSRES